MQALCANRTESIFWSQGGEKVAAIKPKLTLREREVLTLKVQGKTSREVAESLFIAKRTVDFHLDNAYKKLQAKNCLHAFIQAVRFGLIEIEAAI